MDSCIRAVRSKDIDSLRELCSNCTVEEFNRTDDDGNTLLHHATTLDSRACTRFLLDQGSNPNRHNRQGWTPLHLTIAENCVATAALLLERKADPNLLDFKGNSPLHRATMWGRSEIAVLLLAAGADPMIKDNENQTVYEMASELTGHSILRSLFAFSGPELTQGTLNRSLYRAVAKGNDEAVRLLIEENADLSFVSTDRKNSLLHVAATEGNAWFLRQYLRLGHQSPNSSASTALSAMINVVNRDHKTALHLACENGNTAAALALIDAGCDLNIRDKRNGFSALYYAVVDGNDEVFERACMFDQTLIAKPLGADGRTAMHIAAEHDNVRMISKLIQSGASVNAVDETNTTPLHLAAQSGQWESTRTLLDASASPNAPERHYGITPLHCAANHGHMNIVQLLLDSNADPLLPDLRARCLASRYAEFNGYHEVAQYLRMREQRAVESRATQNDTKLVAAAASVTIASQESIQTPITV